MATPFTAELLDLPASKASAIIALAHLDEAATAAARLRDDKDAEALHDFRVAVRRFRVTLRAYPAAGDSLSKKQRVKLRKLARLTNPARDAEVQIAWLRERKGRFTAEQRKELSRFRARLRSQHRRRLADTRRKLQRGFDKLEAKLRRRLSAVSADRHKQPPFRMIAAAGIVSQVSELVTRLQGTLAKSEVDDVHATRIAAKRLRYLLEPLAPVTEVDAAVERLKALQGLLGTLTDGYELETALRGQDGGGATAALKMAHGEGDTVWTTLRTEWPQAVAELSTQVDAIAGRLRPSGSPSTPPSMRAHTRRARRRATA